MRTNGRIEEHARCAACGRSFRRSQLVPAALIRPFLGEAIAQAVPGWQQDSLICHTDLNRFRGSYVQRLLEREMGDLSELERSVVARISQREMLTTNVDARLDRTETRGERVANRVAEFGGSWRFIGLFVLVMVAWMVLNTVVLAASFDPYPFILLNLVLSCLAAVQAPVIMMSQNRQEARDRARAEHDYMINLKAE
ncbi:MAG: DUF1003 domain-containing protein, partial [Geminicoccaceae bacterium]